MKTQIKKLSIVMLFGLFGAMNANAVTDDSTNAIELNTVTIESMSVDTSKNLNQSGILLSDDDDDWKDFDNDKSACVVFYWSCLFV